MPAPSPRWREPTEPCLNCGDPTPGRYCPSCGQSRKMIQASMSTIIGDVVKDELLLHSALPRTVAGLLLRPGHLTDEYIRGRVVRYIAPFRLYLVSSVLFFLVISFLGLRALDRVTIGDEAMLPADPDRARAELLERQESLRAQDTVGMPAAGRAVIRHTLAQTEAALAALDDPAITADPARYAEVMRVPGGELVLPRGTMQQWAREMREDAGFLRVPVERKLAQVGHLPAREAVRQVVAELLAYAPHMVFLLLPVFALLLKLLYIRRDRYYAEHFVFALHVHAFFFAMFLIMLALPWSGANWILHLWMMIYVWLAMKRVYRQGWFRTTVKWWVLGWTYFFALSFGMIGLMLATLVLI
jgi:hypothetical protein